MSKQPKLIILQGLPASGKSTYANNYKQTVDPNVKIVNCESIRKQLGLMNSYHTLKNNLEYLVENERDSQIVKYLSNGHNVISDDTNLNDNTMRHLINLAHNNTSKVIIKPLNTSVHECVRRNNDRNISRHPNDQVPNVLIYSMANRYNR